jgi:hypothetical protein
MNTVHISMLVLVKSTQKLKCWPKVVVQIYKVEMLAKSGRGSFFSFLLRRFLKGAAFFWLTPKYDRFPKAVGI